MDDGMLDCRVMDRFAPFSANELASAAVRTEVEVGVECVVPVPVGAPAPTSTT
jgi:hypothetical protein